MNVLRNPKNRRIMGLKRRLAVLLCSATVSAGIRLVTGGVVPSRGMRFDTRTADVSDKTRAELFWRIYEGAEIRLVTEHLRKTACVVDLGSSLGVLASVVASRMAPGSRLLCVEANPSLIGLAKANIKRNAAHVNVVVMHGAIDYSHENGRLVSFRKASDHTGSALADVDETAAAFTAPVLQLGRLLDSEQISDYTLLADIEGAEAGLLLNEGAALRRCRQMIIEFHETTFGGKALNQQDLLHHALSIGFAVTGSYGHVYVLDRD